MSGISRREFVALAAAGAVTPVSRVEGVLL